MSVIDLIISDKISEETNINKLIIDEKNKMKKTSISSALIMLSVFFILHLIFILLFSIYGFQYINSQNISYIEVVKIMTKMVFDMATKDHAALIVYLISVSLIQFEISSKYLKKNKELKKIEECIQNKDISEEIINMDYFKKITKNLKFNKEEIEKVFAYLKNEGFSDEGIEILLARSDVDNIRDIGSIDFMISLNENIYYLKLNKEFPISYQAKTFH